MSKYSGKSDLYDAMLLYGKSDDEFEAFNRFKELTNGRIIMRFPMTLTPHNIDREIELTKNSFILDKREVTRVVKDKRCKGMLRKVKSFKYIYWGEEYDKLSDIKDYYYSKDIKFKNLSDSVPYFPYVIGLLCKDLDKLYIVVHHQSEIDEREKSFRQCGLDISGLEHYREELKKKLIEVMLKEREMGLI